MKKQILKLALVISVTSGACLAQGLYDLAPDVGESDSDEQLSSLKYYGGLDYGEDDNIAPGLNPGEAGYEQDSSYLYLYAGLVFDMDSESMDMRFSLKGGATHYLDDPESAYADETVYGASASFSLTSHISERLRILFNAYGSYGLEPDYAYGVADSRTTEEYINGGANFAVGYQITERLGAYTGIGYKKLKLGDNSYYNSRDVLEFHHDFRYKLAERSVLTFGARYYTVESRDIASDYTNLIPTIGIEHAINQTTIIVARVGAQIHEVDDNASNDSTNGYFTLGVRSHLGDRLRIRAFARYSTEDYGTGLSYADGYPYTYDTNQALRLGIITNYKLSEKIDLALGIDYVDGEMSDGRRPYGPFNINDPGDSSYDLMHMYFGVAYRIAQGIYIRGTYNYTDSGGDNLLRGRDYDRSRWTLGVRGEF